MTKPLAKRASAARAGQVGQPDLAHGIDAALTLLAERGPTGLVPPGGDVAPLPSLLDRCQALLSGLDNAPSPLRVVHSFDSGGPVADLLRQVANLRLVPADVTQIQGADPDLASLVLRAQGAALASLQDGADDRGLRLVLHRSHGAGGPDLTRLRRVVRGVVIVRHPLLSWFEARGQGGLPAGVTDLESHAAACLEYLTALDDLPRVRVEDMALRPVEALRLLCLALDLPMPPDVDPVEDAAPPLGPADPAMAHLSPGPAYQALCEKLGYAPDFDLALPPQSMAAPAVSSWAFARPDLPLIITCHHKSGTNFLRKVMTEISASFAMPVWMKFYSTEPAEGWRICFHQHGRIQPLLAGRNFRGLHCVRHPMGLIHSAALYHEKCKEPWVDVPLPRFTPETFAALTDRDFYNRIKDPQTPPAERQALLAGVSVGEGVDFGGQTYRQMLTGAATMADKLLLEMRCFSRGVVGDMVAFPGDRRFGTITLEAISRDPQMTALRAAFAHLGFAGAALQKCLDIAAPHCLWRAEALPAHATTGVSDDWRGLFVGPVLAEYRALFGAAEQALGFDG